MKAIKLVKTPSYENAMREMDNESIKSLKNFFIGMIQDAKTWDELLHVLAPSTMQIGLKVDWDGMSTDILIDVVEEEGVFKTII